MYLDLADNSTAMNFAEPVLTALKASLVKATQRLAVLPDQAAWQSLYDYADSLDLTRPEIQLKLHNGGGTSIYGVINVNGKLIGAIIPENSSAPVSGETMAFTLARALGIGRIYQAGVSHFLSEKNLDVFMQIVPSPTIYNPKTGEPLKNKNENRIAILQRYHDHPEGMDAVFKRWDEKPKDFAVIDGVGASINKSQVLTGSQAALASLVQCDGPRPDLNTRVTFMGGSNTEDEVARELSGILLIDALTGQYDRFSGGNLQVITQQVEGVSVSTLASIDNGGTWEGSLKTNLSMVSRFERSVADQIKAMDDFFTKGIPNLGLHNEAEFKSAFDVVQVSKKFDQFKSNLNATANHIRAHEGCYF